MDCVCISGNRRRSASKNGISCPSGRLSVAPAKQKVARASIPVFQENKKSSATDSLFSRKMIILPMEFPSYQGKTIFHRAVFLFLDRRRFSRAGYFRLSPARGKAWRLPFIFRRPTEGYRAKIL